MSGSRHGFTDEQLMEASDKVVESDDTTPNSVSLVISDTATLTTLIALLNGSGIGFDYDAETGVLTISNLKPQNYKAIARITSAPSVVIGTGAAVDQKMVMDASYGEGAADFTLAAA